ncbi:MAG: YibE/F family protein [Bacilli bacterium]
MFGLRLHTLGRYNLSSGLINRKGHGVCGTVLGVLASCIMAWYFTDIFKINGAVMPYSQALLYSGFEDISISDIYIGAIFLSSSWAVMDLSMDIAREWTKFQNIRLKSLQGSG